jgi:hypothetical protein
MKLDQIGFWSEIKLEIIKKYAGIDKWIICEGAGREEKKTGTLFGWRRED